MDEKSSRAERARKRERERESDSGGAIGDARFVAEVVARAVELDADAPLERQHHHIHREPLRPVSALFLYSFVQLSTK